MRDLDQEYDDLMDDLEAAVVEGDSGKRGDLMRTVRIKIEDVLREQMGLASRLQPIDRCHSPNALH